MVWVKTRVLRGFRGFWVWESRFWPFLGAEKPSFGAKKPLNGRVLTSLGAKKPLSIDFQFLIFNFQFSRSRGREKVVVDEGHGLLTVLGFPSGGIVTLILGERNENAECGMRNAECET
ncbi:MAG TPA: hypothetical protein VGN88_05705 [Phycisphaerae bacterium]